LRSFSAGCRRLELQVDLGAASVIVGGETLDASRLEFELSPERLRIEEFTTALPGQTRTRVFRISRVRRGRAAAERRPPSSR
jgi:hypothetical protein